MEGAQTPGGGARGRAAGRPHRARPAAVARRPAPRRRPARPFFAWLHLYDPHEPYRPPPPFRDAVRARPLRRRDRVRRRDRRLGPGPAAAGWGCSTARWSRSSATTARASATTARKRTRCSSTRARMRVPLILWRPGRVPAGRSCRSPCAPTDLAPTLLDLLGAPPLPTARTARASCRCSRAGPLAARPPVYAETYLPLFYMNWAPLRALRDERCKLDRRAAARALRPRARPRRAAQPLRASGPGRRARCARALEPAHGRRRGRDAASGGSTARRRRSWPRWATSARSTRAPRIGDDAGRARAEGHDRGLQPPAPRERAVRERRFARPRPSCARCSGGDPRNAFATLVLRQRADGHGPLARGDRVLPPLPGDGADERLRPPLDRDLRAAPGRPRRGAARGRRRRSRSTRGSRDARILRGGVLASRGDYADAAAELRQAVETDPAKPAIRLDLARVLAEAGRAGEAQAEYDASSPADPDDAAALTGIGALAAGTGDLAGAVRSPCAARSRCSPAARRGAHRPRPGARARGAAGRGAAEYRRPGRGPGHAGGDPRACAEGPPRGLKRRRGGEPLARRRGDAARPSEVVD